MKLREHLDDYSKNLLSMIGCEVTDSFVEGEYEMYLIYNKYVNFYQLGVQRAGQQFMHVDQQLSKIPNSRGAGSIDSFKNKIEKWVSKYHKIYFDSEDERKSKIWKRILSNLGFMVKIDTNPGMLFGRAYIGE